MKLNEFVQIPAFMCVCTHFSAYASSAFVSSATSLFTKFSIHSLAVWLSEIKVTHINLCTRRRGRIREKLNNAVCMHLNRPITMHLVILSLVSTKKQNPKRSINQANMSNCPYCFDAVSTLRKKNWNYTHSAILFVWDNAGMCISYMFSKNWQWIVG